MSEDLIVQMGTDAIRTTALIAGPLLVGSLLVGLMISVMQALTQINEATLTFIPKMVVVGVLFLLIGPWMLDVLGAYTTNLYESIAEFVRE